MRLAFQPGQSGAQAWHQRTQGGEEIPPCPRPGRTASAAAGQGGRRRRTDRRADRAPGRRGRFLWPCPSGWAGTRAPSPGGAASAAPRRRWRPAWHPPHPSCPGIRVTVSASNKGSTFHCSTRSAGLARRSPGDGVRAYGVGMAKQKQVRPHRVRQPDKRRIGRRQAQLAGAEDAAGAGGVAVREIDHGVAQSDQAAADLGCDRVQECPFGAGAEIADVQYPQSFSLRQASVRQAVLFRKKDQKTFAPCRRLTGKDRDSRAKAFCFFLSKKKAFLPL